MPKKTSDYRLQTSDFRLQSTVKQKAVDGRQWTVDLQQGFTLVEILVALAILAVIGFVAVPNFRQYNNDQEMNNTVSNVIRLLQQAQTSGQSQTACVNDSTSLSVNNPATFWDVQFTDSHSFQLQAECIRADTGAGLGTTVFEQIPLAATTVAVSFNGGSGCGFPAVIQFKGSTSSAFVPPPAPVSPGQVVFLTCGGVNIAPLTQVTVSINHTGFPGQTVTVEANGTVHQ